MKIPCRRNNPLQYSCLENSVDRGDWCTTVHGVAKSWTWLSNWADHKNTMVTSVTRERCVVLWAPMMWWHNVVEEIKEDCPEVRTLELKSEGRSDGTACAKALWWEYTGQHKALDWRPLWLLSQKVVSEWSEMRPEGRQEPNSTQIVRPWKKFFFILRTVEAMEGFWWG